MDCPYHEKVQGPIARDFVRGYCQGHPTVEMMVPSLMEEKSYCLKPGGYLKCPIYRSKLTLISPSDLTGTAGVGPRDEEPLLQKNFLARSHEISMSYTTW